MWKYRYRIVNISGIIEHFRYKSEEKPMEILSKMYAYIPFLFHQKFDMW